MRAEHITKVFPGTTALDDVSFDVYAGRVNVLVGENGAGKSTLMKILAGVEQPTSGRVLMDGQPVELPSVTAAAQHGVGIIFQELNLCANLSVLDNLFLAQEIVRGAAIDRKAERRKARDLLARLEQDVDPDELVSNLRIGQQQIVEIAKALTHDVRVLIMDEPTSALSPAEVQGLFRIIRDLKSRGVSIVYISHKLEELLQIGDRITVLRDGRVVAHAEAADVDVPWIIEQMVGRSAASLFTRSERQVGETLLRVDDVTLPRLGGGYLLEHVSLQLHAGEILGLYGLMGAGRTGAHGSAGRRAPGGQRRGLAGRDAPGRRQRRRPHRGRHRAGTRGPQVGRTRPHAVRGAQHGAGQPATIPESLLPLARPRAQRRRADDRRPLRSRLRPQRQHRLTLRRQPAEGRGRPRAS